MSGNAANSDAEPVVVSLGVFPKTRLPDMVAHDQTGVEVPILKRVQQIQVLSASLIMDLIDDLGDDEQGEVLQLVARILASDSDVASAALDELTEVARRLKICDMVARVEPFVFYTQVLAWAEPNSAGRVILTTTFTTAHSFPSVKALWRQRKSVGKESSSQKSEREGPKREKDNLLWAAYRLLLMNFGLLAVPLRFKLNGANHAHSFYMTAQTPMGTEIETLYWSSIKLRGPIENQKSKVSIYSTQTGSLPSLACFHQTHEVDGGLARLNIRMRGDRLWRLWMLVLAIGATSLFVLGNSTSARGLSDAAGWVTAITGALLALMNERASDLSHYLGRYLRRSIAVLASLALLLGARIGVGGKSSRVDWWNHPVGVFERMTVFGLAGLVGTVAAVLAIILSGLCLRRPGPLRTGIVGGKPHADYFEFNQYRHQRRRTSAAVFILSMVAGTWVFIRYDVLSSIFAGV